METDRNGPLRAVDKLFTYLLSDLYFIFFVFIFLKRGEKTNPNSEKQLIIFKISFLKLVVSRDMFLIFLLSAQCRKN